jgi:hypothetical protein
MRAGYETDPLGQHTIFTVFIYVALAIKSEANSSNVGMVVKMSLCFLLIIGMYEVPNVFKTLFRCTLQPLPPTPSSVGARHSPHPSSLRTKHQNPTWTYPHAWGSATADTHTGAAGSPQVRIPGFQNARIQSDRCIQSAVYTVRARKRPRRSSVLSCEEAPGCSIAQTCHTSAGCPHHVTAATPVSPSSG